jgi:hypothetical protein
VNVVRAVFEKHAQRNLQAFAWTSASRQQSFYLEWLIWAPSGRSRRMNERLQFASTHPKSAVPLFHHMPPLGRE